MLMLTCTFLSSLPIEEYNVSVERTATQMKKVQSPLLHVYFTVECRAVASLMVPRQNGIVTDCLKKAGECAPYLLILLVMEIICTSSIDKREAKDCGYHVDHLSRHSRELS